MNENLDSIASEHSPDPAEWREIVLRYQKPSTARALWQVINTLGPYALLWYLMYRSLAISWWLTVPLAILAGAFLVRVFIIFHDCGHGSFFKSAAANDTLGFITGLLTFTPYYQWRWDTPASCHRGTPRQAGHGRLVDADGAGIPRVVALEALRVSAARNPILLFVIAPVFRC
jgi:omega-6 fatty acid desaturase (delta-12 desaturase)